MVKDVNAGDEAHVTHDEKTAVHDSPREDLRVKNDTDVPLDAGAGSRRGSKAVATNVVENPLTRISADQAAADAKRFAEANGMTEHGDLFGRAALVARDMDGFETLAVLSEDEREALRYERDHKWHGPRMLWYSIGLCAIGAATQGWDQTGTNGANLTFPKSLGLDPANSARDEWIQGVINSIIFLTAGLIGAFIVDPLNKYLGRRGEIFVTAICLTVTPIGSACAQSWQGLLAARFIMGIGIGAKNATVPIYSAEMAPARVRGALVMFWQLWVVIGIFLGLLANIAFLDLDDDLEWRFQLGSAFIPSFILGVGIYFCPESPRWLMKNNRQVDAFKAMSRLRAHPIIAARDYYYSYIIYEEELRMAAGSTYFTRLWDCFSVPRIRRSNYGASTVMIAQQMCGINIISFYSSSIFVNVGYSDHDAQYASLGYGAVQVLATIPTLFLIDTKGRRTLTMITFPFMCVFLLAAGLSVLNNTDNNAAKLGPIVLFIYLFTIAYSLGEGPVAFQYSAEVFPTIQREQGMAWAVCINNTFAGVLGLTFPRMVSALTTTGAFGFYAGLNLIAWGMIFCFVRETKQLTLEEIDQVFSVPTKKFISNEIHVTLPYVWKRYVLRKDIPKPPALTANPEKMSATDSA
jgi:sugar porter (SP) family MFS transporter